MMAQIANPGSPSAWAGLHASARPTILDDKTIYRDIMRTSLLLLPLLLAGCVKQSASYYIDGNEHTLTLRAEQERFWEKTVTLRLVAARPPECQRLMVLGRVPQGGLEVELLANGDNIYTLRSGEQAWQVDAQNCTALEAPATVAGSPVGAFRFSGDKLVFVPADTVAADATQ